MDSGGRLIESCAALRERGADIAAVLSVIDRKTGRTLPRKSETASAADVEATPPSSRRRQRSLSRIPALSLAEARAAACRPKRQRRQRAASREPRPRSRDGSGLPVEEMTRAGGRLGSRREEQHPPREELEPLASAGRGHAAHRGAVDPGAGVVASGCRLRRSGRTARLRPPDAAPGGARPGSHAGAAGVPSSGADRRGADLRRRFRRLAHAPRRAGGVRRRGPPFRSPSTARRCTAVLRGATGLVVWRGWRCSSSCGASLRPSPPTTRRTWSSLRPCPALLRSADRRDRPAPGARWRAIGGGTLDGWLVTDVDPAVEYLGALSPRRPPARLHRRRFDWASMVA